MSVPKVIGEQLAKDVAFRSDMKSGYLLFCITPIDDIKGSFSNKCKRQYGKYKILDKIDNATTNLIADCTGK